MAEFRLQNISKTGVPARATAGGNPGVSHVLAESRDPKAGSRKVKDLRANLDPHLGSVGFRLSCFAFDFGDWSGLQRTR